MMTAKEAAEKVDKIDTEKNKAQVEKCEMGVQKAIREGARSFTVVEKLTVGVVKHLTELDYKVVKNESYYDQRDGYSSPESYTISF